MTTITIPTFPGDIGTYADQAPELATNALPRLERQARLRKPCRRGKWSQPGKWTRLQRRAALEAAWITAMQAGLGLVLFGAIFMWLPTLAHAATVHRPAVSVSRAVVTVPGDRAGHEYVRAVFGVCVDRVMAYAEPVSGDYVVFSPARYLPVKAGRAVRLRLGFFADDEMGRWVVTSVVGFECGTGRLVQLPGGARFTVRQR